MDPAIGRLLVATPLLGDANFERTVVVLLDHDASGSAGVVLNRATDIGVEELGLGLHDGAVHPRVVFSGGPVEPRCLLGVTVDDRGSVIAADLSSLTPGRPLRVFLGYAGWSSGQLMDELSERAWWVVEAAPTDVFTANPDELWFDIMGRFNDGRAALRFAPDDPSQN